MKRSAVAALLFLITGALSAEETQRYLVATRQPFRAGALGAVIRESRESFSPRAVAGFESFDGFAADLTPSEVAELRRNGAVRWVEPVVERHALGARNLEGQTTPYGIDLVKAKQSWVAPRPDVPNVVVADTGIDFNHPDLAPFYAGGVNTFDASRPPLDDHGHGTHVSGTITAGNNTFGVVGVAPLVRLWAAKVLRSTGSGSSEQIIKAVDWTIAKKKELGGNWIMNFSLGSPTGSIGEQEAFKRAAAAGIFVAAASGNESEPDVPAPVLFPAAYSSVVAVGAIDSKMQLASFSNQGPELDVVAPGVDVLSTVITGSGMLSFVVSGPASYVGGSMDGSKIGTVTGEYVFCGLGKKEEIPASVTGRIALIKRGDLTFAEKTRNAKEAGAIGVVIFNKDDSAINWTLISVEDPTSATYDWPVTVGISLEDGEALAAKNGGTLTITTRRDDYGQASGTSMATPHVSGVAALIWAVVPSATAADLTAALTASAKDLGATGFDSAHGYGAVSAYDAIKQLKPTAFDPIDPTDPPPGSRPSTGRRYVRRGGG